MVGNMLIDAARSGDLEAVRASLESGTDINANDEQGWTALNFAAGRGDLAMVQFLVEKGTDVFKTGRDNRTPYMIALAAGRVEVVKYLQEVELRIDPEKARSLRPERKYCRAYHLRDLRKFPGWKEGRINWKEPRSQTQGDRSEERFDDDTVVFVHQDFTVTESMWHSENVLFNEISDQWCEFCSTELGFKAPTDLDLLVVNPANS